MSLHEDMHGTEILWLKSVVSRMMGVMPDYPLRINADPDGSLLLAKSGARIGIAVPRVMEVPQVVCGGYSSDTRTTNNYILHDAYI